MLWPKQIRAGDVILLVDGQDVRGLAISDVIDLIKGTPETSVQLLMRRREAWMPAEEFAKSRRDILTRIAQLTSEKTYHDGIMRFTGGTREGGARGGAELVS